MSRSASEASLCVPLIRIFISSRFLRAPFPDFVQIVRAETKFGGRGYLARLFGGSHTDNRAGDRRVSQRPGDGDLAGARVVGLSDPAQDLDQLQVLGQERLLKIRIVPAPVIVVNM